MRPPAPAAKQGPGCFRVLVLLLVGSFLFCCCFVSVVMESADDPLDWNEVTKEIPTNLGPQTSLGLALVPEDLEATRARHYAWRQQLTTWELGYGLSEDVHQQVYDDFEQLAQRFSYRAGEGTTFTWAPPPACDQREWECVFSSLARDNATDLAPLTALFRARQQADSLDALEVTKLVVSFVQNIKYRLPTEETAAFGLLPPAIVVADGSGDCDSKALLAVVLLRQLGVDAVVLLASKLGHAALGVALPVPGKKFQKKYAFVEVTTPGWAVGALPPEYDIKNAWRVVNVIVPK
jgi:hypothetical protein